MGGEGKAGQAQRRVTKAVGGQWGLVGIHEAAHIRHPKHHPLWLRPASSDPTCPLTGCHMRKAEPKQAEKVASGSVTPCSVPATLAV